jgi:hypothetical protein
MNQKETLEASLKSIFPTQQEENRLIKARRVLGKTVEPISDEELETYLTEFQFLLEEWLDMFERQIFDNKTLRELLREV